MNKTKKQILVDKLSESLESDNEEIPSDVGVETWHNHLDVNQELREEFNERISNESN